MPATRTVVLILLTLLAFAGNSVLCRIAFKETSIDAASFTSIRLLSGALMLWLIARFWRRVNRGKGNWTSAVTLFVYAAAFSFAYISLTAATGALILFGAVQATMIGHGVLTGERLHKQQFIGLILALVGLVGLLLPGLSAPPLIGSVLMFISGVAWGIYSLRGKGTDDPIRITAGNFLRATMLAALLSLALISGSNLDIVGVWYAIASGALASGVGYALWYTVLPAMKATNAATVQLSVPLITALAGIIILGEPISIRFMLASLAILGGIALVMMHKEQSISIDTGGSVAVEEGQG
ncbi:DMT family transporter [Sedimenticola thiotaurini]|uniref:Membrane protein n=1 Tax=Sedimenticola thiotaurini TaxID=1543721 RepID=A0A0F7JYT8_9GAMM|nr:DMT family transporter [Sedimenticola thiotaurini]AKH20045.1 membrane protein [Sedimenticola thiotaurini]